MSNCHQCGAAAPELYIDPHEPPVKYLCAKCRIKQLELELSECEQDRFTAERTRDERTKSFDELARAVGWSPERCNQTGDSPVAAAQDLVRSEKDLRESNKNLQADLDELQQKYHAMALEMGKMLGSLSLSESKTE